MHLRLVKITSDALPAAAQVAIVDATGDGISIGRDRAYTPRLRLPVIEVSKHHANVFYDAAGTSHPQRRPCFCIADCGSTYSTFVKAETDADFPPPGDRTATRLGSLSTQRFHRLSAPKTASRPFPLYHGDLIRIGHTTLQVHLHADGLACEACKISDDGTNEIRLAPEKRAAEPSAASSAHDAYLAVRRSGDRKVDARDDHKRQMRELKATYFPGANTSKRTISDRGATRRSEAAPTSGAGRRRSASPPMRRSTGAAVCAVPAAQLDESRSGGGSAVGCSAFSRDTEGPDATRH